MYISGIDFPNNIINAIEKLKLEKLQIAWFVKMIVPITC